MNFLYTLLYNNIEVQNIFDFGDEIDCVDLVDNKIIDPEKIFNDIKKDHENLNDKLSLDLYNSAFNDFNNFKK